MCKTMCNVIVYEPSAAASGTPEYIYVKVEGRGREAAEAALKDFFLGMNGNQLKAFNDQVRQPNDVDVCRSPVWLIAGPMWYIVFALKKPIGPPTYEDWLDENK